MYFVGGAGGGTSIIEQIRFFFYDRLAVTDSTVQYNIIFLIYTYIGYVSNHSECIMATCGLATYMLI